LENDLNRLNTLVGQLPPDQVKRVLDFALAIQGQIESARHVNENVKPERIAVIAALQYFDSLHPEDDWSDLLDLPGVK